MQCRLVDCDDATAQRLVLIDNATHEELTVIERAQALAALVDWLAEHLGIDIVRQWSLDRSYLELLTSAQLQELAAEWKLTPAATKRGELVEWLADAGKEKPCPKAVRGIKAVSLV